MYKMSIIGNLTLDWTGQYKKGEEKFTLGRKVRNIVWSKICFLNFLAHYMYLRYGYVNFQETSKRFQNSTTIFVPTILHVNWHSVIKRKETEHLVSFCPIVDRNAAILDNINNRIGTFSS